MPCLPRETRLGNVSDGVSYGPLISTFASTPRPAIEDPQQYLTPTPQVGCSLGKKKAASARAGFEIRYTDKNRYYTSGENASKSPRSPFKASVRGFNTKEIQRMPTSSCLIMAYRQGVQHAKVLSPISTLTRRIRAGTRSPAIDENCITLLRNLSFLLRLTPTVAAPD